MELNMSFSENFLWGTGAFSYQVEGSAQADGRTESIWDMMCRKDWKIYKNHTLENASDHYVRYKEDIERMGELGIKTYNFSTSWTRIFPDGIGRTNQKGLDFYDAYIDELLKYNITPMLTVYHWDLPLELFYKGGWLNRESSDWLSEYAYVLAKNYGDRVPYWLTLNEPQIFVGEGYLEGTHAPGERHPFKEVLRVAHHVLLAHGKVVKAIRSQTPSETRIGLAPFGCLSIPFTNSESDIETAYEKTFTIDKKDVFSNTWWLDPIIFGHYPEDGLKLFEKYLPEIGPEDMQIIHQPLDFCGLNIYAADPVTRNEKNEIVEVAPPIGAPISAIRWNIYPEAMYWGPKFFYERYKLPIFLTENGISEYDWITLDGNVHDPLRIDFIQRGLLELEKAIEEGVPVLGYIHWSILDNWEHVEGYNERFGLIFVDYANDFKRIKKDSFYYYRDVIKTKGMILKDQNSKK